VVEDFHKKKDGKINIQKEREEKVLKKLIDP